MTSKTGRWSNGAKVTMPRSCRMRGGEQNHLLSTQVFSAGHFPSVKQSRRQTAVAVIILRRETTRRKTCYFGPIFAHGMVEEISQEAVFPPPREPPPWGSRDYHGAQSLWTTQSTFHEKGFKCVVAHVGTESLSENQCSGIGFTVPWAQSGGAARVSEQLPVEYGSRPCNCIPTGRGGGLLSTVFGLITF